MARSQKYFREADPYKDFMNPEKGLGRGKHKALKKKTAPTHKQLLKKNPRLKRDSKGNYSY